MPPNISGLRVGSFACFEAHYPMWLHGILFLHLSQKIVVQVLTGVAYVFERLAKKQTCSRLLHWFISAMNRSLSIRHLFLLL